MNSPAVVVIGSYNHDTSLHVENFPQAGETIRAGRSASAHGGKGSNQAVQAARLGARVTMIACLGRDQHGGAALRLWKAEGIAVESVAEHSTAETGSATILVNADGENLIVVVPGANARLSTRDVKASASSIESASVVIAQLETPPATAIAAFRLARAGGAITVLNAAPAPDAADEVLLALSDFLVVNEGEACALVGARANPVASARLLLRYVGTGVILTLGSKGAVLFEHDVGEVFVNAPTIVPVDTTGAGDALVGAFAAMLARGATSLEALRFGVRSGSFACLGNGTVGAFGNDNQIAGLGAV